MLLRISQHIKVYIVYTEVDSLGRFFAVDVIEDLIWRITYNSFKGFCGFDLLNRDCPCVLKMVCISLLLIVSMVYGLLIIAVPPIMPFSWFLIIVVLPIMPFRFLFWRYSMIGFSGNLFFSWLWVWRICQFFCLFFFKNLKIW